MIPVDVDFFEEPLLAGEPPAPGLVPGEPAGGRTVPSKGLPVLLNVTVGAKVGTTPEMLLLLMSKVERFGKVVRSEGMEPVRLFTFKRICFKEVMFARKGDMVPTKPCEQWKRELDKTVGFAAKEKSRSELKTYKVQVISF